MRAQITFCNDIDFASWDSYKEVHNVLFNDFGIRAQDSFWLFDPTGSKMALFKGSIKEKGPKHDEILEGIMSDDFAILHSAGNFDITNTTQIPNRELIAEGLEYLKKYARVPEIWTNHGDEGDIQNIGGKAPTYQKGDDPVSDCYILDLLLQYGVHFYCTDTNLINNFVFNIKEKSGTQLLEPVVTRSGHKILTFNRYRGLLPKAPDAYSLGKQLSEENLSALIAQEGYTIIYQHWCVHRMSDGSPYTAKNPVFPDETLERLSKLTVLRNQDIIDIPLLTDLLRDIRIKEEQ
ncbi:MAG: hypothetical protein Q8920_02810 [Bacillota bacterium]|nr:hypothetical protein [Bacillota bacterium]